jgi:exodeoxyribonuclease VII small subunit
MEQPSESTPAPSFEAALGELESVVQELEKPEVPLERALELFEKGIQLSDNCRKRLAEAETRVEILMERGAQVEPEPFEVDED